jgi:hypothetical protein
MLSSQRLDFRNGILLRDRRQCEEVCFQVLSHLRLQLVPQPSRRAGRFVGSIISERPQGMIARPQQLDALRPQPFLVRP